MGSLGPLRKWEIQGEFIWGSDIWAYIETKWRNYPWESWWRKKTKGENP